ncbi:MAG: hypothetical protein IPG50_18810 [Myxococcales bacterium]|nr:hypothetical protein [Myxococcales bacterium]
MDNIRTHSSYFVAQAAPPPMVVGTLTMDALMTYCQGRLADLDARVAGLFAGQKKSVDDAAELERLISSLASLTGGVQKGGKAAHDIIRAYQAAIATVGPDTPLGRKLEGAQQAFISQVGTDGGLALRSEMSEPDYWSKTLAPDADGQAVNALSVDDLKPGIDHLKGLASELSHGMELGMISLQSLMSQRQMAIQVATNLIQSVGDTANKIAQNVGR